MPPIADYNAILQFVLFVIAIVGALWATVVWYRGTLPLYIGRLVQWEDDEGERTTLPDLARSVDEVNRTVCVLEDQHHEVAESLHRVKSAQIDIAEAVNNPDKSVPVRELEERHFGNDGVRKGDFVTDRDGKGFDD